MLKKSIVALGIMAAAQFSAHSAVADEGTGVNLLIAPGYTWFDDSSIDDTGTINLGIGYKFSKHWGVEATYVDIRETDTSIPAVDLEGDGYRVDALYFFNENKGYLPYAVIGGGEIDFNETGAGVSLSGSETFANVGVGVKKYITPHLALRGDVRAVKFSGESDVNTAVMFGLDYFFGDRGPKPAPVVAVAAPMDSDGDGVIDANDACPGTPAGVGVDSKGCPLDSDNDGVADYKDQCPKTPAGARVDEKGCQYVITETASVELDVLFDLNKAVVKPEFMADINLVGEFLTLFPKTSAKIEGHTDSTGDEGYNQQLSQKRAEAVRDILIKEHKIDASRLTAVGYGEAAPRASNDTKEGRKSNRRVVSIIATEVEKTLQ
jgi:OOP family OmpA-OmpF porin